MPTYQPNIPTGSVPLNQDYLNLQGNFQQLEIAYNRDHVPYSDTSGVTPPGISGMHKALHMVPVSTVASNPPNNQPINGYTATTGFGQLLSAQINDGINTDTALFWLTGGNRLAQLTRNFTPSFIGTSGSTNGYTFIPGGLIVQFGFINSTTTSSFQTVTFSTQPNNIAFPNACFAVFTQPYGSGTPPAAGRTATVEIRKSTISNTKFDWVYVTTSGEYSGFWWIAIGN
jgi:hypothetical protein